VKVRSEAIRQFWIFDGSTLLTTGFGFWIGQENQSEGENPERNSGIAIEQERETEV
jgi:hypothetical protein